MNRSIASDEIALGDLQTCLELPGVLDLIDVDLGRAADRLDALRVVVHVVPARRIVQAADHVDAACGEDEVTVVEIVLLGCVDRDRRARLLARVRLLCRNRCNHEDKKKDCRAHVSISTVTASTRSHRGRGGHGVGGAAALRAAMGLRRDPDS